MNVAWDYTQGTAADDPGVVIDPGFGYVRQLADPERVRVLVFPDAPPDSAGRPEILHVSYVPGRELRAVYRFDSDGAPAVSRVDFHPPGVAERHAERARRAVDPALVRLIPDWDAVAWRLPADERLPQLGDLLDPSTAARTLAGALDRAVDPGGVSVRLLAYVPRRRAVVRIDGEARAIAKVGRMRDESVCHRRQVALYRLEDRRFALPRPLGVDAALGARFEEVVDGRSVEEVLVTDGVEAVLDGAAEAIAALHGVAPASTLPAIGAADLLEHLDTKTLGRLRATLPGLACRIDALADRLSSAVPIGGREVTLHGDFHPANLIFTVEGPVFIDLDNLSVGPPERDLAIFAGRIALLAIKDGHPDGVIEAALDLPARYRAAGGGFIDSRAFAWYVAATVLARQMANGVRRLGPGLSYVGERLLDLADELTQGPAGVARP